MNYFKLKKSLTLRNQIIILNLHGKPGRSRAFFGEWDRVIFSPPTSQLLWRSPFFLHHHDFLVIIIHLICLVIFFFKCLDLKATAVTELTVNTGFDLACQLSHTPYMVYCHVFVSACLWGGENKNSGYHHISFSFCSRVFAYFLFQAAEAPHVILAQAGQTEVQHHSKKLNADMFLWWYG